MVATRTDFDEIRELVQLYIDGADGDVARLKQAFYDDAHMMGHVGPVETNVPISEFFQYGRGAARRGRTELHGRHPNYRRQR